MKIAVLAGGISSERDVSLSSGGMIYYAFRERGHKAVLLDVYLGIEGETEGIFDLDTDWAAQIGGIREENPDIEAVKAQRSREVREMGYRQLSLFENMPGGGLRLSGASRCKRRGRQDSGML